MKREAQIGSRDKKGTGIEERGGRGERIEGGSESRQRREG